MVFYITWRFRILHIKNVDFLCNRCKKGGVKQGDDCIILTGQRLISDKESVSLFLGFFRLQLLNFFFNF